jgi:rhodanese-related sulfurtransferase
MFISCDETKRLVREENAQLIDVRTPEEFSYEPVPGSVNIPLHIIDQVAKERLDPSRPIIVFCRSGQRSYMAQQILMSQGFTNVHNMGSFMAWYQCPDPA